MTENPKQTGMTDPRLEIGKKRNWHEKVTPTTDKDLSPRARAYKGFLSDAIDFKMIQEGSNHAATSEIYRQSGDALRSIRNGVVVMGFNLQAFDMIVRDGVVLARKKAKEQEEDWKIINKEFPGQFEDADFQARLGDVPANSNWGNHAFSKSEDAGGFEPTRRGW